MREGRINFPEELPGVVKRDPQVEVELLWEGIVCHFGGCKLFPEGSPLIDVFQSLKLSCEFLVGGLVGGVVEQRRVFPHLLFQLATHLFESAVCLRDLSFSPEDEVLGALLIKTSQRKAVLLILAFDFGNVAEFFLDVLDPLLPSDDSEVFLEDCGSCPPSQLDLDRGQITWAYLLIPLSAVLRVELAVEVFLHIELPCLLQDYTPLERVSHVS